MLHWLPLLLCISSALSFSKPLTQEDLLQESFEFLTFDDDRKGIEEWVVKVLRDYPRDLRLVELLSKYFVTEKDRLRVIESFRRIAKSNACGSPKANQKQKKFCEQLRSLWDNGIYSLPFYETTSGKLAEAESKLRAKDCDAARILLDDLEAVEGPLRQIIILKGRAYVCLSDDGRLELLKKQKERLEVFR